MAEFSIFKQGGKIGFFSGDIRKLLDDFQVLKPTAMVGAPRVFQRIYDRVMGALEQESAFKRWLFFSAYEWKRKALLQGKQTPFF